MSSQQDKNPVTALNMSDIKDLFKQIIVERQEWIKKIKPVNRDLQLEGNANYILTGLRRAGKSYLMYLLIHKLGKARNYENILYINFEDERLLELTHRDFNKIIEAYREMFSSDPSIFFDEIQNIPLWQKFARRLADEQLHVFITGSNADMLSSEIASTLGGRYMTKEVLTLSFKEYLMFQNLSFSPKSVYSEHRFKIKNAYESYLQFGGFPELLKLKNKREYLSGVYQKLFYGDLIARYKISNVHVLKLLVKKLAESVNNETSVNRIKNLIKSTGLSIGNNTVYDYIDYLKSSYLIASISNYHNKFAEKETKKKYYFLDTGILGLFLHNQPTKLLENQIYIELRRRGFDVYYLKHQTEVDFYLPEEELLIQVAYSIDEKETYNRETRSIIKAMKSLNMSKSLIITNDEKQTINTDAGTIEIIPAWQWLLDLG